MAAWADREAQFFDLESALVRRAAVPGEAMAKARKKRISQVLKTVKTLRASAWHNMKALDKILKNVLMVGQLFSQVQEGDRYVGLAWGHLPPTLVLHADEGSPGFAMLWFLNYRLPSIRFLLVRNIFHREWNDVRNAISNKGLWWVVL